MQIRWRTAVVVIALLSLSAVASWAGDAIKWQTNFAAAKAAAKKSHKLIFVDFMAEW